MSDDAFINNIKCILYYYMVNKPCEYISRMAYKNNELIKSYIYKVQKKIK